MPFQRRGCGIHALYEELDGDGEQNRIRSLRVILYRSGTALR